MQKTTPTVNQTRMIRLPEVRARLGGVSVSTVYRWIDNGIMPKPTRLGVRAIAWRESEIEAFINSRCEQEG